ncbi:hypothetical protein Tco_0785496 [Tanacetum coccineum]
MAGPVEGNVVARRVIDYLVDFSGETSVDGYMRFFKAQQLVETRLFLSRMREEAQTSRNLIATGPGNVVARCVTDDLIAFSGETAVLKTSSYGDFTDDGAHVGMRLKAKYAADMGETIYVVESFPEYNVLGTVFEAHIVKRLSLAFVDGHCIASLDWELQARMAILIKPSSCGGIPRKFKVTTSPGNFLNMNSLIASAFSFLGVRIALSLRNFSGMSIHVGSSSPSLIFAGSVPFLTAKTHWLNSCFAVSIPPFGEYSLTLMLRVSMNTLQYLYSSNLFMQA